MPDRLQRALGAGSATVFLVGTTIGSGIFRVPGPVAAHTGSLGALVLCWVAGGIVTVAGGLSLAEVAARYPRAGGPYVYLLEAFGRLPAFLFGWIYLLVFPTALGALSLVFAEYLATFVPLGALGLKAAAGGAILLVGLAGFRSVRWASAIQNVSTAAKLAAMGFLAVAAFVPRPDDPGPAPAAATGFQGLGQFGVALIAVLWAYNGWQDLSLMAGEVKHPARNLPRAFLLGTGALVAIYLTMNLAYLHVLPLSVLAASTAVASDTAARLFGAAGASFVSALVMVSTFSALNGAVTGSARVFYSMAEDGLFFRALAAVHPRYQTPYFATGFTVALGMLYVFGRSFEQLTEALILGLWPFLALAVGAVFVVRRRGALGPGDYRTPGYPVVPLIFIAAVVALLGDALVEHPASTLLSLGITVAGVPVFYLWQRLASRS